MTAAKKMDSLKSKLAALKAKSKAKSTTKEPEKRAEKKASKVTDIRAKLKKSSSKEVSIITNPKEREKLARYGITAVVVNDPDLGEQSAEVRVDGDLVVIGLPDRSDALACALGLYHHIKSQAEKLAKAMAED